MEEERFRENVAALVRRDDGLFLLCERLRPAGAWQLVQGGLEDAEDVETACFRELEEELGAPTTEPFEILALAPPQIYRFPPGVEWTIAKNYDGQRQTVCLVQFTGEDSMFDLTKDDPPEFGSFAWFSRTEVVTRCWELKRPIVEAAFDYFHSHDLL